MKKILIGMSLLLVGQTGAASEKMLRAFFSDVETLQASFYQTVTDGSGMTLESSSGTLYLDRPGRFRWDYKSDDPDEPEGQQIISDGKLITFYEPDLETATQRSFSNAVEQVPTMVLMQTGGDLNKHFDINDIGLTDGLSWVTLKPKDSEAGYRELMIGFSRERLNTIVLTDSLENETKLTLNNVQNNLKISAKIFEFSAPEGVDIIK